MRRRIYIARQRFLRRIRIARITPEELKAKLDGGEDVMVVDVRHRVGFESEPTIIPGALHLMIEELEARPQKVPRGRGWRGPGGRGAGRGPAGGRAASPLGGIGATRRSAWKTHRTRPCQLHRSWTSRSCFLSTMSRRCWPP